MSIFLLLQVVILFALSTHAAEVEVEDAESLVSLDELHVFANVTCVSGADCSNNGVCKSGSCLCIQPYTGPTCAIKSCPNQCNGQGVCDYTTGTCSCYNAEQLATIFPTDGPEHEYGFTGPDCSLLQCFTDCGVATGQGKCNQTTGLCQCAKGFWGPEGTHCNSVLCNDPCSNHGFCVDNHCMCDVADNQMSGWTGEHCEKPVCPNHCFQQAGLGQCINATCVCTAGWYGDDCSQVACPSNYPPLAWIGAEKAMCSGSGACVNGTCQCLASFGGADCSVRVCPSMNATGHDSSSVCSGHGTCQPSGHCVCNPGYTGEDCFDRQCSSDCGASKNRGVCDTESGNCDCADGWHGAQCSFRVCSDSCNGHGMCLDDACVCNPGFQGVHCELPICGNNCSASVGQGVCINDQCVCAKGFYGAECLYPNCPKAISPTASNTSTPLTCAGNGVCSIGQCVCNPAWSGADCTQRTCPHNCSNVGVCNSATGTCVCPPGDADGRGGFTGKFCEKKICPRNCGENLSPPQGKCSNQQCVCAAKFSQPDCRYPQCPSGLPPLASAFSTPVPCSGAGKCVKGKCECLPGFAGANCGSRPCLNNCTSAAQGTCLTNGVCRCDEHYAGVDCAVKACPKGCSGNGQCAGHNKCVCNAGWTGKRCGKKDVPPVVKTAAASTSATAQANTTAVCSTVCTGNTRCLNNKCVCKSHWVGANCDQRDDCPGNCTQSGSCVADANGHPVCKCASGRGGNACQYQTCSSVCSLHGSCFVINGTDTCVCDAGYGGSQCGQISCDAWDNCNGDDHGSCVLNSTGSPSCICIAPWTGPMCLDLMCSDTCSQHGQCLNGQCECENGYHGNHCEIYAPCPNGCSNHGECNFDSNTGQGVCDCDDLYDSPNNQGDCSITRGTSWKDDSGKQVYECSDPYYGPACEFKTCTTPCKNNGTCADDGICDCLPGFKGDDCSGTVCPLGCSGSGECDLISGTCRCFYGYSGPSCNVYNSQLCTSTCTTQCSLNARGGGLISVYDNTGLVHLVSLRRCHQLCTLPNMCNVMFGSGHPYNPDADTVVVNPE